ncbi:MAG: hypothetical protein INR71_05990 [Terriglobus roseus]|nr:hypothetical protein [Terriglobus roseus]
MEQSGPGSVPATASNAVPPPPSQMLLPPFGSRPGSRSGTMEGMKSTFKMGNASPTKG